MNNEYIKKYIQAIKNATDDNDLSDVINAVYEDGFEDGTNN
jgi:hypothetical protein